MADKTKNVNFRTYKSFAIDFYRREENRDCQETKRKPSYQELANSGEKRKEW